MSMTQYVTVPTPCAHDGVGRALRSAYHTQPQKLPDDMLSLLARLDK